LLMSNDIMVLHLFPSLASICDGIKQVQATKVGQV
jgi:hypothetical protein